MLPQDELPAAAGCVWLGCGVFHPPHRWGHPWRTCKIQQQRLQRVSRDPPQQFRAIGGSSIRHQRAGKFLRNCCDKTNEPGVDLITSCVTISSSFDATSDASLLFPLLRLSFDLSCCTRSCAAAAGGINESLSDPQPRYLQTFMRRHFFLYLFSFSSVLANCMYEIHVPARHFCCFCCIWTKSLGQRAGWEIY